MYDIPVPQPSKLEAIRNEKQIAEQAILAILETLRDRTGFCPVALNLDTLDATTWESPRIIRRLNSLSITLESI
jgi:hypothetical protein